MLHFIAVGIDLCIRSSRTKEAIYMLRRLGIVIFVAAVWSVIGIQRAETGGVLPIYFCSHMHHRKTRHDL